MANCEYQYVLKEWVPKEAFIDKETKITSFGSCFARHVSDYMKNKGYNINISTKDKNL